MTEPQGSWPGARIRFGAFELLVDRHELRKAGLPIEIGERAFQLLVALAEKRGQLVTKEQLTRAAWGGRTVETSNLTVQIATLRRILADGDPAADKEQFIRTVPGQGYVFRAGVAEASTPSGPPAHDARSTAPAEPLTMFIGRDSERAALIALLSSNRLVCLIGLGGVGKTRLALRLSGELAAAFPDGVRFVDLAPLTDPGQVKEAVAAAASAGAGGESAETALIAALRGKRQLLILDNAEHLVAPVRQLLSVVLGQCPGVAVLVTSRESLGIPGESVFRLSPLALPPPADDLTAASALRYDAVRLFADRARALRPDFEVTDANAVDVTEICRRLDGIALAIEMAIPRLEVLTPRQLSERLQDRFRTLGGLRYDTLPRQRTLRAMFDWSWELLSSPERGLLQLVAVFAGGATLAALEALAVAGGPADTDTLDQLTRLAQKSLLVDSAATSGHEAEPRYRVLETTRQYALEQLEPAQRTALFRRHALHFAGVFEQAGAEWPEAHSATWIGRYGPDADNLRSAMRWAFDTPGETELALRLVAASFSLWWELPGLPLRESRAWYTLALQHIGPETPAATQARLWLGQSWSDTVDGDVENFPAADRAVQLFRQAGDPVGVGAALWRATGTVMYRNHHPTASALLEQAIQILQTQHATKWQALCHIRRADLLQSEEALDEALVEYDRALEMVRATGHEYGQMVCGGNRSFLLFMLGRRDEAITELQNLRRDLPLGLRRPLVSQLAMLLTAAGRDVEALEAILDSLTGTLSIGMLATLARTLEALALLLAESGEIVAAAPLTGFVLKLHAAGRLRFGPRRIVFIRLTTLLDVGLPALERDRLMAHGKAWTPDQVTAEAVRLCGTEAMLRRLRPTP